MKTIMRYLLAITFYVTVSAAPVTIYNFDSAENEVLFYKLSDELRCLVCQNQNIAESNSELAQDLRRQIFNMLKQGKSEDEIIAFMVERYGDYVLFDPPFKPLTWMLWLGPLAIFILGVFSACRIINIQRQKQSTGDELTAEDSSRLDDLKHEMKHEFNQELKQADDKGDH